MGNTTNQSLLSDLLELRFDAHALCERHHLSPARFADFWHDPEVARVIAAWTAADRLHEIARARDHQLAAAAELRTILAARPDPVETRRAATTLARIAAQLLTTPHTRRAKEPTAQAVAAFPPSSPRPRGEAALDGGSSPLSSSSPSTTNNSAPIARRPLILQSLAGAAPPLANSA